MPPEQVVRVVRSCHLRIPPVPLSVLPAFRNPGEHALPSGASGWLVFPPHRGDRVEEARGRRGEEGTMTVASRTRSWQQQPVGAPAPPHGPPSAASLFPLRDFLLERWGGSNLSVHDMWHDRPIVGGSAPSSHRGAAFDWRYMAADQSFGPGPGREILLREVLPFLIDHSFELNVQQIHDYVGCAIWKASRGDRPERRLEDAVAGVADGPVVGRVDPHRGRRVGVGRRPAGDRAPRAGPDDGTPGGSPQSSPTCSTACGDCGRSTSTSRSWRSGRSVTPFCTCSRSSSTRPAEPSSATVCSARRRSGGCVTCRASSGSTTTARWGG